MCLSCVQEGTANYVAGRSVSLMKVGLEAIPEAGNGQIFRKVARTGGLESWRDLGEARLQMAGSGKSHVGETKQAAVTRERVGQPV